jgi:hypothetical protein
MSRWYAKVPKAIHANLQFRLDLLREAGASAECRDWIRRCCADDVLFHINAFSWTYDPRLESAKTLPFVTFAIQDHAIRELDSAIDRGRDVVIEKSRDLGASWLCLSVFEWRWRWKRDQTFLCISRDADEVDKPGYPDSLFAKLDIVHQNTPGWLMPRGWSGTSGRLPNRKRMTFQNPENGSTINGEATVAAAGVGGRRTAILIDEFSRIDEGYQLLAGTADVTGCRIFNFTPYGTGNASYEMATRANVKKVRLHWSADPRKNKKMYQWDAASQRVKYFFFNDRELKLEECGPHVYTAADADAVNFETPRPFEPVLDGVLRSPVYDREDTRRNNRQAMAMMWDIDYVGTEYRAFDEKMLLELNAEFCCPPYFVGDVLCDEVSGEPVGLTEAKDGPLKLWLTPDKDGKLPKSPAGYACGCDLSLGVGATNSCASFADALSGQKVAAYVTPFEKPEKFAAKVVALCRLFRSTSGADTHLAWERTGPGETFATAVQEMGYTNFYYHGAEATKEFSQNRKPGWPPTPQANKDALLGEYNVALRQRRFVNRDAAALEECQRFMHTQKGIEYVSQAGAGRRSADGGIDPTGARENHGDRVVSDALCWRAIKSLGMLQSVKPEEEEAKPEEVVGTFGWRKGIHDRLARELEAE